MSRIALVVGISTYWHAPLNTLGQVPANDAEAIAQRLEAGKNFHVYRLPKYEDPFDNNAPRVASGKKSSVTKSELDNALLKLFRPDDQEDIPDTALFYFSGHGLLKSSQWNPNVFLGTSDVDPSEEKWGLPLTRLQEILESSHVKQQIVWIDCCYSGALIDLDKANPQYRGNVRDRCFIAACRAFEESWQEANDSNSVFTKVLIQGLDILQSQHGTVDNLKLTSFIHDRLVAKQRPKFCNVGGAINLTQAIRSNGAVEAKLEPDICPYQGLSAFDATEKDVQFFYGRTALTDELIETIWNQNFLVVLGPSGSGKSSVVRAGLIHGLRLGEKRDTRDWHILPVITPGEHPLQSLAEAFISPNVTPSQKAQLCQSSIQSLQEQGAIALADCVAECPSSPVVLVVDQFEEIFTLCQDDREREQFLACLIGALNYDSTPIKADNPSLRVVITMRADFFGKCLEQDHSRLAELIKTSTVPVTSLNQHELRDAIVQPAARVGLQLEPELVQQIIVDVQDSPGSLPLLQYALTELWEQWHQRWQQNGTAAGNTLLYSDYDKVGGVRGALEEQANKLYNRLSEIEKNVARRIFLELTQLGEGTEDTRRRIFKHELINDQHPEELLDQVIHKLIKSRLIVSDQRAAGTFPEVVLDVAHETLIRHWAQLRQWVIADRDTLRTERKLKAAAQEWQERGQNADYLWLGAKLSEAQEIYQQSLELGRLDQLTQNFVRSSQAEQERIEKEKSEQIYALEQALLESRLSESREKAAHALHVMLRQPRLALELALQAVTVNLEVQPDRILPTVQTSLQQTMEIARLSNTLRGCTKAITSVAFSPDGSRIVSGSLDWTLRLWDLQGNLIEHPFRGHVSGVKSVAFSPDGSRIVSGSSDRTVRLWDLQGNPIEQPFQGHERAVASVAFSPDGSKIVSGSSDGTVRLWNLQGKPIGQPFQGHEKDVLSVAFSPDGSKIVSGSSDKTLWLWDLQGQGSPIGQPFQGHERAITSVAFSPDGTKIVSGSLDTTLRLWRGNWQAWLKVCCDRLAYHLISEDPEIDIAQTACAICMQHAWSKADLANTLKRQGNDLARQGKTDLALAKLQEAAALDPSLNLDPEAEVRRWSSNG